MKVELVDNPQYTKYYFGDIAELIGKRLQVIDSNSIGDCLCLNDKRTALIDVDYRDVKEKHK